MSRVSNFFLTLFRFFSRSLLNFFILCSVGGITGLATFEFVDMFIDRSKGVDNIVIMLSAAVFFPLFTSLYIIFLIQENRKNKKKKK